MATDRSLAGTGTGPAPDTSGVTAPPRDIRENERLRESETAARDYSRGDRSPEQIEREIERTRTDMSRTLDAIQRRLSPGQLFDQAIDYVRSGPGEFAGNLGQAVKNNPIPVALMGIGMAWLSFMGTRRPAYLREPEPASGAGMGGRLSEAAERAGDMASATGEHARATAAGVRDTARSAGARVRRMAEDVRELASEWRGTATSTGIAARERAGEAYGSMEDRAVQARRGTEELLQNQPLVVGALAVAVGAVLGALLPRTRREDELMGETRDRLMDQAADTGREALHGAKDVARKAAETGIETAKEEAERRGVTSSEPGSSSGSGASEAGAHSASREQG